MIGFWVPERIACPRWSRAVLILRIPPLLPRAFPCIKHQQNFKFFFPPVIPAGDQGKSGAFQFVKCSTVCRGQILPHNVPSTYTEKILPPVLSEGKFVQFLFLGNPRKNWKINEGKVAM
jgi:hypothetical protein